ncbi:AAA family ATPase [Breoghania sp.]|uniref:AAA family ATPase n=1 Tax=Breoghania sp. TaxID=2065378 RepID=UPI002AA7FBB2|nr:AAA family ATPase [Breoghania sp.]
MLRRIEVQRFKSIRDAQLEFGRVNIFIGANGSGKSNFLEAIGLISACFSTGITAPELAKKGLRQSRPALMKSAHKGMRFPQTLELIAELDSNIEYKCNLTARDGDASLHFHSESCSFSNEPEFGRSGNGDRIRGQALPRPAAKTRGLWDQTKASTDFPHDLLREIDEFSEYKIYSPQTDYLRGVRPSSVYEDPIGLHGEGLPEAVSDVVRQYFGNVGKGRKGEDPSEESKAIKDITALTLDLAFLPGWTRSFRVGSIDPDLVPPELDNSAKNMLYFIDQYMHERRNTLSAYDSSEGTLFLLFMAVILCHKDAPRIFAVDNIDSALNPQLTRTLIEAIVKVSEKTVSSGIGVGAKQVFLTSHNPTSIDALDIFDNDQRVFVVYRDDRGLTKCDRLAPAKDMTRDEWAKRSGGKTLSQMWVTDQIPHINGLLKGGPQGLEL